ncbi:uracil-DNA glycosylase family protein [Pseudoalteromonas fenneropenaei]|uniref:Uracil-DNA glycosylase family protein n=1 Tax=Pseudoalteromonas fenneropenaei TaxID=1737459 RepID=A0ABV7CJ15_9GAMM
MAELATVLAQIERCQLCADNLPDAPKPILQFSSQAKILLAGQAPGRLARLHGRPFADPSGELLRRWLGVNEQQFYDPSCFAIVPMAFCFPGRGKSGDNPPPVICQQTWHQRLLALNSNIQLTICIGSYAQQFHMAKQSVTTLVQQYQQWLPSKIALPHPSPRNRYWLAQNPWFEQEVIPQLQARVASLI